MIPSFPTGAAAGTISPGAAPGRRVVDAPTRMFHWLLAVSFAGAWLTAEGDALREVHSVLGYTMAGLLAFRLVYGLVGPRQARLAAMVARVSGLRRWAQEAWGAVKSWGRPGCGPGSRVNGAQGLALASGAAAVGTLALVAPLVLSGLATLDEWGGHRIAEITEELHEFAGNLLLGLVLAHLGALLLLSVLRRRNEAARMFTGRVPGVGPDLVRRNHAWLAALLLLGALGYWAWEWLGAPGTGLLIG